MIDGMTIGKARTALVATAGLSLVLALATAQGAPLPREDCDKLASERSALTAGGIPERMAKGPAWARTNLPSAKLAEIERFIMIDEQLAFRCGMSRIKLEILDEDQPGDGDTKKPAAPGKEGPAAKAAPPKAPAGAPAKKPAGAAPKAPSPVLKPPASAATAPAPSTPKPKPKPKPKAPADPATGPS